MFDKYDSQKYNPLVYSEKKSRKNKNKREKIRKVTFTNNHFFMVISAG